jgi:hypothetical protein
MYIEKSLFLKEFVNSEAQRVPDAGNRSEGIGARPQMGYFPQKFECMPFFLERIGISRSLADEFDMFSLQLDALVLSGRFDDSASEPYAGASG